MAFAEEKVSYSDTRKRTSTEYVKFSPDWLTVLRILDPNVKPTWKHWIQEANGGRGLAAVCPNVTAQTRVCPIDQEIEKLDKERDKDTISQLKARRKYIVNVLDRTPYTVCDSCNEQTPGVKAGNTKVCINCKADVKGNTFAPLNKVKILESGPRLFLENLNTIEEMQANDQDIIDDFGEAPTILDYDITFQTKGVGRERKITAVPQPPVKLTEEDLLDTETGEPQRLFPLDVLAEPTSIEEIELMRTGATVADLNAVRGIV